jgi:hypothetical protein
MRLGTNRAHLFALSLAKGCLALSIFAMPAAVAQCFGDADLAALTTSTTSTASTATTSTTSSSTKPTGALLYVWSPRMVLSATQAADVAQLAQSLGLAFTPIHDARVSSEELSGALQRLPHTALASSRPLCSPRLVDLEATRHFPSSFVVRKGQLDPLPLVGAMPAAYYQSGLQARLAAKPNTARRSAEGGDQLDQCIPQNEFITLPPSLAGTQTDSYGKTTTQLGAYERVSPDGRFILRSFSGARLGDVSLIELSAPSGAAGTEAGATVSGASSTSVVRIYETPLSNEAFPVQGTWRYLVSTAGEHYALSDILTQQRRAKPLFKGGMTGFYAAASELVAASELAEPSATPAAPSPTLRIRSFSWPNASGDSQTQGEGALAVRTITVNKQTHRITADTGHQNICGERQREDGALYALPMISVDGQEFAALPQQPDKLNPAGKQTMRIYAFGDSGKGCQPKTSFNFASGKAIFGFPNEGPAPLAYEYQGQAWWFNRALNQPFNIAPFEADNAAIRSIDASAFPGLTQDGRVIYGATWQRCTANPAGSASNPACQPEAGYVISDPWQSNAYRAYLLAHQLTAPKACITQADVERVRRDFAALHTLTP